MIIEDVVNLVREKPKRLGMRIIYKEFQVKNEDRQKWRDFWDEISSEISLRSLDEISLCSLERARCERRLCGHQPPGIALCERE